MHGHNVGNRRVMTLGSELLVDYGQRGDRLHGLVHRRQTVLM